MRPGRVLVVLLAALAASLGLAACGGPPAAKISTQKITSYVALGDGFAAAPYTGKTDAAGGCLRSDANYPALTAEKLGITDFTDASCTYARSSALLRSSVPFRAEDGAKVPAQFDALKPDTQLVTVTIGLSDRSLLRDLFNVCVKAPCEEGQVTASQLTTQLVKIGASLQEKLDLLASRAPNAQIYVVGYPQLVPDEGQCEAMPDIDQEQQDVANATLNRLNQLLVSVARSAGADFLDVAALSVGHDMCGDEPWVAGDHPDKKRLRLHPLEPLEQAIADALAAQIRP